MDEDRAADTFKILVATDCHLGFAEKDQIRGDDSLVTFKEILQTGKEHQVDFILLGGDLFHDNKPSRKTLHGTMALLREYCMGEKPCQVEFISDQSVNFANSRFPVVNYEDSNYNVSMPVFSIHGNHDDPTGDGNLCSLDLLSVCGLVNYFGRATSIDHITISPLLMQKGQSKLALFGLGSVRDERLHRTFLSEKVKMLRPKEDAESWFNIFVLHQNRVKHGPTNYIPEKFLEDFLDLVIWGHEHECIIKPSRSTDTTLPFFITQPGSSIATSLCEGESKKKHIGILEIREKNFRMTRIPLQTVRPFYMQHIVLADTDLDPTQEEQVHEYLTNKIEELIIQASEERTGHPKQPDKPLIRLKVDYSGGFTPFNTQRFGQKFVDKVANPRNLLLFHRKKTSAPRDKNSTNTGNEDVVSRLHPEALDTISMDDLIKEYLSSKDNALEMNILTERRMAQALHEFVDKDDKDAISTLVKWQLNMTQSHLKKRNNMREEDIEKEVLKHTKQKREREEAEEPDEHSEEIRQVLAESRASGESCNLSPEHISSSDEGEGATRTSRGNAGRGASSKEGGRGRGRGRGRGSRGGRRGRAAAGSNRTITESFTQKPKGSANKKNVSYTDQVVLSDSDDELNMPLSSSARKGTKSTAAKTSARPMAKNQIQFDESDDDSDDPFSMEPSSKRQRK